ncbi:MAG: hypothetical protein ACI88G_000510 [Woeseiaceae bacterium]|jgi:hypothetical protein
MSNDSTAGPSKNTLLKGGLLALVIAFLVTVLFVLPAEYGVDPTGIGSKLGLLDLAETEETANEDPNAATRIVQGTFPGIPQEFDYWEPEVLGDPYSRSQESTFRSDTLTIALDVGEQVEYKAVMRQGDALVYSWKLDAGVVYTDFHADPGEGAEGYPDQYYIRYKESEESESNGSLVAPFGGNHGWYWLNIEDNPIEIKLEVHGFYDQIEELGRSYQ